MTATRGRICVERRHAYRPWAVRIAASESCPACGAQRGQACYLPGKPGVLTATHAERKVIAASSLAQ